MCDHRRTRHARDHYTMWHGLYVVKGTPKEIIALLNDALRKRSPIRTSCKVQATGTGAVSGKRTSRRGPWRLFAADCRASQKLVESSGAKPSEARSGRRANGWRRASALLFRRRFGPSFFSGSRP